MAIKTKFSIRVLLVVMTLVVLAFAFGQWNRQRTLRDVARLEQAGVSVVLKRGWWTLAWLPPPTMGQLEAVEVADGSIQIAKTSYSLNDVDDRLKELRVQLGNLGVNTFLVDYKKMNGGRHQILFDLSKGEPVNSQYRLKDMNAPAMVPGM